MSRLVAAAHYPPPIHGMAVAVDSLVGELEKTITVHRVNVAAPALQRNGAGYHAIRVGRVLRAAAVLVCERRRANGAFISCDAGTGMVYTFVLVTVARVLGYQILLQHHSYAYLIRRSRVLAAIVRLGGSRLVHLVTAPQMDADFRVAYPGTVTRVVGIARGIPVAEAPDAPAPDGRLVLGFLGNVTVEKGVGLAVDTARAAARAGLPVELRVGGPADRAAAALLTSAGEDLAVTVVGPVYGVDRDAFLDGIDVFLFPSRYSHESFGLVAWEAMARGRPVVAHRSGCLTAAAVGGAGLVIERDDDFVARAVPVLQAWWHDAHALTTAAARAHEVAASAVHVSREQVERLCADLADGISAAHLGAAHGPEPILGRED